MPDSKPVVASFVATFLPPEMLHVYRQITALQEFRPHVITQKWVNRDRFPFPENQVSVARKSKARLFRRVWRKQLLDAPIHVSSGQRYAILRQIEACGAKLLHVYFGNIGVYLLPVLRAIDLPVVVSFHGADAGVDLAKGRHLEPLREVFDRAGAILARSESLRAELAQLGCPPEKIRLSRTGIPMDDWAFIERPTPDNGAWRLIQACRLIEKKGIDTALRAFAIVHEKHPNATFEIAGEGPLLQPMRTLASELCLGEAVTFPGFLDQVELRAAFEHSHVFVHPSRTGADGNREGVPNSMLEAMATGLPVAATTHGGIPEAVAHGEGGLLVEENDERGLSQQLLALIEDDALRKRLASGARTAVETKFSQHAQVEALESVYRELTS